MEASKKLQDYSRIETEVFHGSENSRIDLLLIDSSLNKCYIEVKNVTMVENNISFFPNAVSTRATKHLREPINAVRRGNRVIIFYCIQRKDVQEVRPADDIDPEYSKPLRCSIAAGVQTLVYQFVASNTAIEPGKRIPVVHS